MGTYSERFNTFPQSRRKTREKEKQAYTKSSRRWAKSQSFVKVGREKEKEKTSTKNVTVAEVGAVSPKQGQGLSVNKALSNLPGKATPPRYAWPQSADTCWSSQQEGRAPHKRVLSLHATRDTSRRQQQVPSEAAVEWLQSTWHTSITVTGNLYTAISETQSRRTRLEEKHTMRKYP